MNSFELHLPHDDILEIHDKATSIGLENKRAILLAGIHRAYISDLKTHDSPSTQLMLDLSAMNQVPFIRGGVIPLERWLRNATYQTALRPNLQAFFREKADRIRNVKSAEAPEANVIIGRAVATVEEKVIHTDDKLPIDFLAKAAAVADSVARLLVPRHDNGELAMFPYSTKEMIYMGTGWVIGPRHVITNQHVVNARDSGEPAASQVDFELQGNNTRVQFDYNTEGVTGDIHEVEAIQACDKHLDFAILRLKRDICRPALKLWSGPVSLPENHYQSVNIIQHPGGAPKQIALRNNLIAKLTDSELSYFTDTEGGSSGSPVCSDDWHVIALHRASTIALGNFEFQGKTTAWVNVGTRIDRLIQYLQDNESGVWNEIKSS